MSSIVANRLQSRYNERMVPLQAPCHRLSQEVEAQVDQNMQMQSVQEQSMTMRVSPTLIMVNQLLALSSIELQHIVRAELEQNPALESVENITCTACGAGTNGKYCPVCMQAVRPTLA